MKRRGCLSDMVGQPFVIRQHSGWEGKQLMKEPEKEMQGQVVVDAAKLGRALKTVFEGVTMVFDSLGADCGLSANGMIGSRDGGKTGEEPEEKSGESSDNTIVEKADDVRNADTAANVPEMKAENAEAMDATETTESAPDPEPAGPSLTLDDVTKVIVQKIRKDRSNNGKIGEILKTFSVSKVSELPAEKYEAFLTELAAL